MRTFFQFITLLFFGLTLQAQEAKKAKDLLDEVYTKAKSYDNIVIDFRFTLQNTKQNQDQDSKGNVTLKGNLFVLNFMALPKCLTERKTIRLSLKTKKLPYPNMTRMMKIPLRRLKY